MAVNEPYAVLWLPISCRYDDLANATSDLTIAHPREKASQTGAMGRMKMYKEL